MIKSRIEKIRNELGIGEALLITSQANRFYLTGFHSSAGQVFITADSAEFLIDFRYVEKATECVDSCTVTLSKQPDEEIKERIEKQNIKTLYLETETVSVSRREALKKAIPSVEISTCGKFDKFIEEVKLLEDIDKK